MASNDVASNTFQGLPAAFAILACCHPAVGGCQPPALRDNPILPVTSLIARHAIQHMTATSPRASHSIHHIPATSHHHRHVIRHMSATPPLARHVTDTRLEPSFRVACHPYDCNNVASNITSIWYGPARVVQPVERRRRARVPAKRTRVRTCTGILPGTHRTPHHPIMGTCPPYNGHLTPLLRAPDPPVMGT